MENLDSNFMYITKEDFKKVIQLSRNIAEIGCVISNGGTVKPSKTGLYVYRYDKKTLDYRKTQVNALGNFFSKDWYNLLNKKIQGQTVKNWLQISDQTLDLCCDNANVLDCWTYYYGIDLSGPSLKITDFNSDRATVIGFQDEFCQVFSKYYFDCSFSSFYDDIVPLINKIVGKNKPKVFILTYPDEAYITPIANFAKRFGYSFGSIDNADFKNVDLILRQVKSEEILNNTKRYKNLFKALKDIPMINPLGSFISGHKGWITLITLLGLMPREWFPNTWLISGNKVLNSFGQSGNLDELSTLFLDKTKYNNRKNYVVKKGFGAGGRGVFIGVDLKKHQWNTLWDSIRMGNESSTWVVEEKLPRNNKRILIGDWATIDHKISVKPETLNLIERVYSVYGFNKFTAEVFGKNSNKVNASGYTFPACLI